MLDKIVLGTAQFGMRYGINSRRKISKNEIFKILDFSVENQINKLDTAPVYGNAEDLIGEYSKINNLNFKITSKFDTKNKSIEESINESLNRLNSNKIDTFLFHSLDSFKTLKKTFFGLKNLKKYSDNYGISLYTNEEVSEIQDIEELNTIQIPFNILDNYTQRGRIISLIKQKNKKLFFRSIFLQGLFFIPLDKISKNLIKLKENLIEINRLSTKYNLPIHSIAVSYVFSQNTNGVLVGVESISHLKKIINSIHIIKNEDLFKEIDSIQVIDKKKLDPRFW